MSDTLPPSGAILTAPIVLTITAHSLAELFAALDRVEPTQPEPQPQPEPSADPAQLVAGIAWGASPAAWRESIANPSAFLFHAVQAVHNVTDGGPAVLVQPGPALWGLIVDEACELYGGETFPKWTDEHKAATWAVLGPVLPALLGGSPS